MKNQLILKVLDRLDRESILPTMYDLGLPIDQYNEILEIMQHGNLIDGLDMRLENGIKIWNPDKVRITIFGIEYLEKNKNFLRS